MDNMELLNSKMEAIADEVRELSGNTDKMGLDAIAENVNEGNAEIALQKELIEQAISEMEGKVAPQLYENGYSDGYAQGYADGLIDGKTDVSTLPNFKGKPTEEKGVFHWAIISQNTPWVPSSVIKFNGVVGESYMLSAELKCETCDNAGVGFLYEDGSTDFGMRRSFKDNFFVSAAGSNPRKKVVGLGFAYGSGGSIFARNFMLEKPSNRSEGDV